MLRRGGYVSPPRSSPRKEPRRLSPMRRGFSLGNTPLQKLAIISKKTIPVRNIQNALGILLLAVAAFVVIAVAVVIGVAFALALCLDFGFKVVKVCFKVR